MALEINKSPKRSLLAVLLGVEVNIRYEHAD